MKICVDFDGTIVKHEYPGEPVKGAIETLKKINKAGHDIILYTMRSGEQLFEAINFLNENGIVLYGINENKDQKKWTQSPKIYANYYIDDAAVGCPLIYPRNKRPYVKWSQIRRILTRRGVLEWKSHQ